MKLTDNWSSAGNKQSMLYLLHYSSVFSIIWKYKIIGILKKNSHLGSCP